MDLYMGIMLLALILFVIAVMVLFKFLYSIPSPDSLIPQGPIFTGALNEISTILGIKGTRTN